MRPGQRASPAYFEKALALGAGEAGLVLGMVRFMLGEEDSAAQCLPEYLQKQLNDKRARQLPEGVRSGNAHVRRDPGK